MRGILLVLAIILMLPILARAQQPCEYFQDTFIVDTIPVMVPWGDINLDGNIDNDDVVRLVTYIFSGGQLPQVAAEWRRYAYWAIVFQDTVFLEVKDSINIIKRELFLTPILQCSVWIEIVDEFD